jgi:hypothetical protein
VAVAVAVRRKEKNQASPSYRLVNSPPGGSRRGDQAENAKGEERKRKTSYD